MNDNNDFGRDPAGPDGDAQDVGELLAAYLADDLDEVRARRLERRLEADAELRAQLDRIHDAVVSLRRVDAVTMPEGLNERIRARVAAEAEPAAAPLHKEPARQGAIARSTRTAPSARGVAWWRRPIAAVAALALLAVVAVSSLSVVAMRGSQGGDSAARDSTAMMAESAEEAAPAEGGGAAEGRAAPDDAQTGEVEAFGFDEPAADAAAPEADRAVTPVDVPDLESSPQRLAYLEEVRDRPETRRRLEGGAEDDELLGEQQRVVLIEQGLEPSCAEVLVEEGRAAVELILTDFDGVPAAGAVVAGEDGDLRLVLVDRASCEVLAEERLPA